MPTVGAAVDEAQIILTDDSGTRYTEAQLISYVNQGLGTFFRIRPDLFAGTTPPDGTLVTGSTIPLDYSYYSLLIEWVVAKAEQRDDQFSEDGRLVILTQKVERALLGGGL